MHGFPAGKRRGISHRKLAGEDARSGKTRNASSAVSATYTAPRGALPRQQDGFFEANLDYCKGCGICAHECWPGAIKMVNEED